MKLVQRLYDVFQGRVLIDGQDVAHATRRRCARRLRWFNRSPSCFTVVLRRTSRTRDLTPLRRRSSGRRNGACASSSSPCLLLVDIGRSGRARREAVGRRAATRGASAGVLGRCADPDPGRGDFEPRLGVGGADPGVHGPTQGRANVHRHRAPIFDGAGDGPILVFDKGQVVEEGRPRGTAAPCGWSVSTAVRAAIGAAGGD